MRFCILISKLQLSSGRYRERERTFFEDAAIFIDNVVPEEHQKTGLPFPYISIWDIIDCFP
jgi:hypothetical protein